MPRNDNAIDDSSRVLSGQEQDIVRTLNTYLKTIDDIDPDLLADRPCIDLSIQVRDRK